ncbi:hypothetical protein NC651_036587 [Populus alba x Populus x berolinensis]|nr:hypothetical protein NC651_036587 [Populus alba x Populus x berolinensis]
MATLPMAGPVMWIRKWCLRVW